MHDVVSVVGLETGRGLAALGQLAVVVKDHVDVPSVREERHGVAMAVRGVRRHQGAAQHSRVAGRELAHDDGNDGASHELDRHAGLQSVGRFPGTERRVNTARPRRYVR